jgi:hypothetical protein
MALAEPFGEELWAPIRRRMDARRAADAVKEIRVVDLERRVERLATSEEIADGIVAETIDQYNEKKLA